VGEIDYDFFKKQSQEGQKSSSVHESVNGRASSKRL